MNQQRLWVVGGICLLLGAGTVGCTPEKMEPDDRAAEVEKIRSLELAWATATREKDLEAAISNYAPDAVMMPPGQPMVSGAEAVRKSWTDMLALKGFEMTWQPLNVEAAKSGDLAYVRGSYEMTLPGPQGEPVKDKGKYLTVWKKQANGEWKTVADIFNSDLPGAP